MKTPADTSYKKIAALSLPIMLSNLSTPLIGVIDTAVVGQLPGPEPIGAVALGSHIFAFVFWAFGFLRMGTTGLTAQASGREDSAELRDVLYRALLLAGAMGGVIMLSGPFIRLVGLEALPASESVEALAGNYIEVRIFAAPATFTNYALLGWFIGLGRTRTALALQLTLNLSNIAFDILFVTGFDMGVEGVALGTVVAQYLAAVIGLIITALSLRKLPCGVRSSWSRIADPVELRRTMSVGRDIMIRSLSLVAIFLFFTAQGASMGDVLLAANGILLHFVDSSAYFLDGIAHATETLVGRAIGRKRESELRAVLFRSTVLAAGLAALCTVLLFVVGGAFIDALTSDAQTRDAARQFMPWAAMAPIVGIWCFQLDGVFIGATEGPAMRNSMLLSFGLFIGAWWLLHPFENHGLWAAFHVAYVARALTLGAHLPAAWRRWFENTEAASPD